MSKTLDSIKTRNLTDFERTAAVAAATTELTLLGAANVRQTAEMLREKGHQAMMRNQTKKAMRFYEHFELYKFVSENGVAR